MSSSRIAFLFPGQGSQHVGMGKDFYNRYPFAREVYEQANDILGWDIAKLSFEGPKEKLTLTSNTQPAIMVHSYIACTLLMENGVNPSLAMGHSLGEYSALLAAGAMDFPTALCLVKERGRFMHSTVPESGGAMAALLGLDREVVEAICREASGVVEVANYNAPGQIVISGEQDAVEAAVSLAKDRGVRKAVMLPVGAPFHSSLLEEAGRRMREVLESVSFSELTIPVYSNVTSQPVIDSEEARELLKKQVRAAVRWEDSVRSAERENISAFIEVGPGRVLSGLNKRIVREVPVFNVEDSESLEKTLSKVAGLS
ncbi:MAG: ACP S-malonyltransferase [Nitrospinota bacterium]|nr:ACP S-malonyltransferase [Nitrospinota bacterium]MDP7369055.1 ACP S-malonyltransferase [Nitrospinota bacterium]MDP7502714.1 ACP S-malonyltransferase [Nitrospinota bacterium]MDP7663328.1 ACP S-malonyltransferase [Nitrospinota bacterium]